MVFCPNPTYLVSSNSSTSTPQQQLGGFASLPQMARGHSNPRGTAFRGQVRGRGLNQGWDATFTYSGNSSPSGYSGNSRGGGWPVLPLQGLSRPCRKEVWGPPKRPLLASLVDLWRPQLNHANTRLIDSCIPAFFAIS
jgi:hypothetical protein